MIHALSFLPGTRQQIGPSALLADHDMGVARGRGRILPTAGGDQAELVEAAVAALPSRPGVAQGVEIDPVELARRPGRALSPFDPGPGRGRPLATMHDASRSQ